MKLPTTPLTNGAACMQGLITSAERSKRYEFHKHVDGDGSTSVQAAFQSEDRITVHRSRARPVFRGPTECAGWQNQSINSGYMTQHHVNKSPWASTGLNGEPVQVSMIVQIS